MHSQPSILSAQSRASALIAVYWVIAILALAVFTSIQFLLLELETHAATEWEFRATQFADMGLAIAAHPAVERGDPLLRGKVDATGGYRVAIRSEGARINLNHFAETVNGRIILKEIFIEWGLDEQGAVELVDALADWVDADDESRPFGAEANAYRSQGWLDRPRNRPFPRLQEVEAVRGFEAAMAAYPAWRETFTVLSGGPLDLNDAPADLIRMVCRCGMDDALRLVSVRLGADLLPDTEDDTKFDSVEAATQFLNLGAGQQRALAGLLSVNDPVTRLISVGTAGDVSVERSMVLANREATPALLDFHTRVLR